MKASARSRTPSSRAFVALGSNQGDRLANLAEAARRLAALGTVTRGPVLETEALVPPEDPAPQPRYLNTVVALDTALDAVALHGALKRIERLMGRRESTRWAPRVIDLDLLLHGAARIDTPGLTVPHPRMLGRDFVMKPLAALLGTTTVEVAALIDSIAR